MRRLAVRAEVEAEALVLPVAPVVEASEPRRLPEAVEEAPRVLEEVGGATG